MIINIPSKTMFLIYAAIIAVLFIGTLIIYLINTKHKCPKCKYRNTCSRVKGNWCNMYKEEKKMKEKISVKLKEWISNNLQLVAGIPFIIGTSLAIIWLIENV